MNQSRDLFWLGLALSAVAVVGVLWLQNEWSKESSKDSNDEPIPPETDEEKEALRNECERLREQLEQQKNSLNEDFQQATFEQLQSLLTQYPSARKMAQAKPKLPAKNFSALFTPLENLLEEWGITPIGEVWETVAFNPQYHQADSEEIETGEEVYVRFVGYRQGEKILVPAKVSQTLPAGVAGN